MTREELLKVAKPILFNTDMVRAILDGRKTATRRRIDIDISNQFDVELDRKTVIAYINQETGDSYSPAEICRYQPGDIMYVRETWCWCPCWDCGMDSEEGCCDKTAEKFYNHDRGEMGCYGYKASFEDGEQPFDKWHPSIHMPKKAARIFLKVTDVRMERLQEIDGQGVLKEGINSRVHQQADYFDMNQREMFEKLWNSTIKKSDLDRYGWEANTWVWVIEFEIYEKPERWCV